MEITRNVIHDLLPLYFADEASGESRALVEAYFADHPDFAADMRAAYQRIQLTDIPAPLPGDHELQALGRTRSLLRRKGILMAVAIFLTALPLSFYADSGEIHFLLDGHPWVFIAVWILALAAWIAFGRVIGRLKATGLA